MSYRLTTERPTTIVGASDGITITVHSQLGDHNATVESDCDDNDWGGFYRNLADHLLGDAPLAITDESAARVIGVLEYMSRSARQGKVLNLPCQ